MTAETLTKFQIYSNMLQNLLGIRQNVNAQMARPGNDKDVTLMIQKQNLDHDIAIMRKIVGGLGDEVTLGIQSEYGVNFKFLVKKPPSLSVNGSKR